MPVDSPTCLFQLIWCVQKPLSFDWQTVRAQVRAMQIGPLSVIFASGYHIFYAIIEFVSK